MRRAAPTQNDRIMGLFQRTRLFGAWPTAVLHILAQASEIRTYAAGALVAHADEPAEGWIVVEQGFIENSRTLADGRRWVADYLREGQFANLIAVLDQEPVVFDLCALEPTTLVLIPAASVHAALCAHHQLALDVINLLCRRTRFDYERHIMNAMNSMPVRVAKSLLYLTRGSRSPAARDLKLEGISQDNIAGLLGVSRMSIVSALRPLVERGLVITAYRQVMVRDLGGLIAFISEEDPLTDTVLQSAIGRPEPFHPASD